MRKGIKCFLLVILVLAGCKKASNNGPLFRIIEKDRYGYMNSKGYVVIPAVYFAAGDFSEGLAPVRPDGTYGYIDTSGQLVIPSQYDYADLFSDGVALVYKSDSSWYIDKTGKRLFQHSFAKMGPFINGRAIIETASRKMGIINKHGELIIDTLYNVLMPTQYGHAIVHNYGSDYSDHYAIIDSAGRIVVPFDKYDNIEMPTDGYYKVRFYKGAVGFTGFIDTTFQLGLFRQDTSYMYGIYGEMHNGFAQIFRYRPYNRLQNMSMEYMDYINSDGKTILNDSTVDRTYPFSNNRAFIEYMDHSYRVVNTKGEKVTTQSYSAINGETFSGGMACVASNGFWGVIDTNAHFVINPEFTQMERMYMSDNYFFFRNDQKNNGFAGILDRNGHIVLRPILQQYDPNGFVNGLLSCLIQERATYVDSTGYIVWRAPVASSLYNLNTDMMVRSYYRAHSTPKKENMFDEQENIPRKIQHTDKFPAGKLSVIVSTNTKDTFYQRYNGHGVFVVNDKNQSVDFNTTDNILYMKVQAFTQNKKWKDIEYIPRSWCGNSYYKVTLGTHQYWQFVCPVYDGAYKTKLRIELKYRVVEDEETIYSNEFDGGINPGQLWREYGYTPSNIMDPYLN